MRAKTSNLRNQNLPYAITLRGMELKVPLILNRDPVVPNQAATKSYLDYIKNGLSAASIQSGTINPLVFPGFEGDVVNQPNTNIITLKPTGIIPGTYVKVVTDTKGRITGADALTNADVPSFSFAKVRNIPSSLAGYGILDGLSNNGGTAQGAISVVDPVDPNAIANKKYVDSISVGSSYAVGDIVISIDPNYPNLFVPCEQDRTLNPGFFSELFSAIGHRYSQTLGFGNGRPWEQVNASNYTSPNFGTMSVSGSIPQGQLGATAFSFWNKAYLTGGTTATGTSNKIYTASIDPGGFLGTWTQTGTLPNSPTNHSVFFTKGYVYSVGGLYLDNSNTTYRYAECYKAALNSDGTLGTWSAAPSLPAPRSEGGVLVCRNKIYYFGGKDTSGNPSDIIYYATIDNTGIISSWSVYATLPRAMYGISVFGTTNKVYILGGGLLPGENTNCDTMYMTTCDESGNLSSFEAHSKLPFNLTGMSCVSNSTHVYVIGGVNYYQSSYYDSPLIYRAVIDKNGDVGNWASLDITNYVTGLSDSSVLLTNAGAWILGGAAYGEQPAPTATYLLSGGISGSNNPIDGWDGSDLATLSRFGVPNMSELNKDGLYAYIYANQSLA